MSGPVRVIGFLGVLALVFAGALGVGYAVGPVSAPVAEDMAEHVDAADDSHDAPQAPTVDQEVPGGLMVSEAGYTFELQETTAEPGAAVPVSFLIEGPDGRPVKAYDVDHGKQLHLIAVRRDLTGFQHVHPELGSGGTWSTALDLTSGTWRLFADFNPTGGVGLTLGADLSVAGDYQPRRGPGQVRTDRVDGYTVTLAGNLVPGADSELVLTVERDGRPVADLQPYLGAYGHLVALRAGDLAYLHVHPDGAPGDGSTPSGPEVVFEAEVPSDGDYRLFLDFRHEGVVHTAEFSLATSRGGQPETGEGSHGHGH
ncbi:MAG TPA: hypothetical protein VFU85_02085 [Nocardioides sp.]|nr:hypothetical protein [Nocardioides sp.]